jgi:AP-2 complex subunit sigma-1
VRPSSSGTVYSQLMRLYRADSFFGNVCELVRPSPHTHSRLQANATPQDLVFNFYKVYAILDEVFLAGEMEETSKQVILDRLEFLERLE